MVSRFADTVTGVAKEVEGELAATAAIGGSR
jgi:hypothetical protein